MNNDFKLLLILLGAGLVIRLIPTNGKVSNTIKKIVMIFICLLILGGFINYLNSCFDLTIRLSPKGKYIFSCIVFFGLSILAVRDFFHFLIDQIHKRGYEETALLGFVLFLRKWATIFVSLVVVTYLIYRGFQEKVIDCLRLSTCLY